MVQGSKLTTGLGYKFVESIDNLFVNLWHELWKSPGELCSDKRDMICILANMLPESVLDLKCLDTFSLVEQRRLERKLLTSSRESMKDNTPSGAFRISSITLDSVTTTSHCSISGILNIAFGHWENFLVITCAER